MGYQQMEKELFNPASLLYALTKGKDAFLSALEESRIYGKNFSEQDLSKQLISAAEQFIRSCDLDSMVPERYRPFVKFVLSKPFCETVDFVSTMAKKYGEGKTTGQALRGAALELVKERVFGR